MDNAPMSNDAIVESVKHVPGAGDLYMALMNHKYKTMEDAQCVAKILGIFLTKNIR